MADIEDAIYTTLSTHAGLSALVSTRIYRVKLPQNPTLPAVTFTRISKVPEHAMGSDPTTKHSRWQFSCWATTQSGTVAVAKQVEAAMSRKRATVESVVIQDVLLENTGPDLYEDDTKSHQLPVDLMIHYEE